MTMKRQGDLLIVSVESIPEGAKKLGHKILAEGEATGHLHELDSGELYKKNENLYFRVSDEPATLMHPEHAPLAFVPGVYQVIRQREYEPKAWRYVCD
ncbi:MAG: hypothetical protein UW82_C0004G0064 [candidate division WWE3 bacterium GW2011_GWC2_44_9]|uniref:Uncharacterized protein n=1 Tax=candidate division WWE3 bacterium GW2011_GWC2_44_9 TaxID=1619125 RepID=A0A0G1KNE9_UNCKA|nr:MAG: hypothetical protein UW82_C0004G0064 [candidate division WWE3 bacterium GW2011_GWC2_44_9]OGW69244.1 MAG: hypothetical protein A2036_03870 [Omnitrophica bacterium GWA2_50_21]